MSEQKYRLPEKLTCATCIYFQPEIVYTHKGRAIVAWYGHCALRSGTFFEDSDTCSEWEEKK